MTRLQNIRNENIDRLDLLDKEDLISLVQSLLRQGGVSFTFSGKGTAQEISRKVRPRGLRSVSALHVGSPEERAQNTLIEGENLQAMVTLYKYRNGVDLILTDPPYNTGVDFRYNDRWDTDPNDPELGALVTKDDGSRHTKWMRFMLPRLYTMKDMLKESGVLAICIDDNELFHLGMMLDEVFGEENRIAIINWQKAYAPKNDSRHVSTATEYVLVYAKDKTVAKTGLTLRTEDMDSGYTNPDNDPNGEWTGGDATSKDRRDRDRYGVQSPFTGALHYPGGASWRLPKSRFRELLETWGSKYVEKDIGDGRAKALVIKGGTVPKISEHQASNIDQLRVIEHPEAVENLVLANAQANAEKVRDSQVWAEMFFNGNGYGRPRLKRHLKFVKKGKVPMTYWADEDYDPPIELGTQSWDHEESGHSQTGINELNAIVGKGHNFDTVKPLKLYKKIIQLWCPAKGVVLDPFAGSGTTAHAVLELNQISGATRRFILIEQGAPAKGDKYARSLTAERIRRAINGERPQTDGSVAITAEPLGGGFEFKMLTKQIDANALLSMKREELIDVVLASHFEAGRRKTNSLIRAEGDKYEFLFGKDESNEGYYMVWAGQDAVGELTEEAYDKVLEESRKAGLKAPHHVYARHEIYQSDNVRFYQVPDRILAHLGFNEYSDAYNNPEEDADA